MGGDGVMGADPKQKGGDGVMGADPKQKGECKEEPPTAEPLKPKVSV